MGVWYHHVTLHCCCPSSWSTHCLLLLACSTCFWHCEQLLAVAGVCARAIVGPLFILTICNPPCKQQWGGVLGLSWVLDFPLVMVGLTCAFVVPVIDIPQPHCLLPGPCCCCPHVLAVVVPVSLPLFHHGPHPCCCPPIPPGLLSAVLAST